MNALETVDKAKDALTVRRVYGDPYQEEGLTVRSLGAPGRRMGHQGR